MRGAMSVFLRNVPAGDGRRGREDGAAVAERGLSGATTDWTASVESVISGLRTPSCVADALVVEPHAQADGQAVVRRPAILDVAGVVLIDVRPTASSRCRSRPAAPVSTKRMRSAVADVGVGVRQAVWSRLPVDAEAVRSRRCPRSRT